MHIIKLSTNYMECFWITYYVYIQSVQCPTTDCTTGRMRFDPRERQKYFSSSLSVQTDSEAHPASYPMGTAGIFLAGKARLGRDADYSPHIAPRSRMSRSYISSPLCSLYGGSGTAVLFTITHICRIQILSSYWLWGREGKASWLCS
jgi:hypothetical protein